MRVKLGALVVGKDSFNKLFNEDSYPIAFKWQLMKLKKAIDVELQQYEEQKFDLVKKYGVDDGKNNITVPPENMGEFIPKINELLGVEVDIRLSQIKLKELEGGKLTAEDMTHLEPFIKEN